MLKEAATKVASIEIAKELVQDVFLSVYLRKQQLDGNSNFKSYLYTALRNKVYNHYDKELSRKQYELHLQRSQPVAVNNAETEFEAKELNRILKEKIDLLPEQCRKVFILSREKGLSYKEIGAELNISPNTVDQHIRKALKILKGSVGGMLLLSHFMKNMVD